MTSAQLPQPIGVPFGDQQLWTDPLDGSELARHIDHCKAPAPSTTEKGQRLERLMVWLLSHLPGMTARRTNTFSLDGAQEIDVSFWNDEHPEGFPGATTGRILGECKNWQRPVDSSDVAWFAWKLRLASVSHGVLFAANGITMDGQRRHYAVGVLTRALEEDRTILVLTLDDIAAVSSTADLRSLLIDKQLALGAQDPFD